MSNGCSRSPLPSSTASNCVLPPDEYTTSGWNSNLRMSAAAGEPVELELTLDAATPASFVTTQFAGSASATSTRKTPWPMVRLLVWLVPPVGGELAALIGVGGVKPVLPVTAAESKAVT